MNQILLITLLSAATAAGAAQIDLSKLPEPAKKEGVTFAKDIRPLFEASCVRCHGAEKPKGELRLDTLEGALKGSHEGKVITPSASAKSKLVIAVSRLDEEFAMPPKPRPDKGGGKKGPPPAKPLTNDEVALIRAWIDQGAK